MKNSFELPRWSHYLIALVSISLALAIRQAAAPYMGSTAPFALTTLAVIVTAYIGGVWPGLFATLLSVVGGSLLFLNVRNVTPDQLQNVRITIAAQITICTFVSLICGALQESEREAATSARNERRTTTWLNSLLDSITDSFFALDSSLHLTHFNSAAREKWGFTDGSVGKHVEAALPLEIYELLKQPLLNAKEQGSPVVFEFHDQAEDRWFEIRVFPSPEGVLVYFLDVTHRVWQLNELAWLATEQEKTAAFLDSLLTYAPVGFAFFDREHRFERVNNYLSEVSGISQEEHIGRTLFELIPATAPSIESIIDEVYKTGKAVNEVEIEGEFPGDAEQRRYWLTGFYPVLDRAGEVKSVGAVVVEMTQRKIVEARLRESEERFRMMADHAPVMIWVCNADTSASWFNRPWLEFREENLEQALTKSCFEGIHEDDENRVLEAYRDAFHKQQRFSIEYRVRQSDGSYKWLLAHGSPLLLDNGPAETFLVSCVDISDRKAADENIRQLLINERAARSDAERANRVMDEFVATLSHELRTPLTTMLGWTELLRKPNAKDQDLEEGLAAIERSTRLQMQLISDLLDMSRISSGKIRLNLEYSDLYDLVDTAVGIVRPTAEAKGIDLIAPRGDLPSIVRVDPDKFTQVLWNLLVNAIKFTPVGGEVRVGVELREETALISVTDTGVGISEEFLPLVFDRFRQADGTVTRKHGGLGLGLSIAKQLSELHGGEIEVFSEGPGKGSRFTVTIPRADGALEWNPRMPAPDVEEDGRPLRDICVLLVEDDDASRLLLARIMEEAGAEVIPADSAACARKFLRERHPDVMISDIGMPDEDGYQLMRSIRSLPLTQNGMIPAAALTAFAGNEARQKALDSGFQLHLTKPIESNDLIQAVSHLTELRGSLV